MSLKSAVSGFGKAATDGGYPSIYTSAGSTPFTASGKSDDHAQSWTKIGQWPTDSLDQIKTIAGDPDIYGRVYVGFNGSGYAYLDAAGVDGCSRHRRNEHGH